MDVDGFDLAQLTPGFLADPYPTYRALRERAPVKRMPDGSLFLTRPSLAAYTGKRDELVSAAADLFAVVGSGAVQIRVNQTFPLQDAARAHEALEARRTTGSTVLLP